MATRYRRQQRQDPDIKHEYHRSPTQDFGPITRSENQGIHSNPIPPSPGPNENLETAASVVQARIKASAIQNSSLLVVLKDTEDAPGALAVKLVLVEKTEDELEKQEQTLRELEHMIQELRNKRQGSHVTLRNILKRASAIIARIRRGRLDESKGMISQEAESGEQQSSEQTYFDLLAMKSKEDKRKVELQHQLRITQMDAKEIQVRAQKHGDAHAELDALYDSIFAGPTPGFQEEDAAENEFKSAREKFEDVKSSVLAKRKGIRIVEQTQHNLKLATLHAKLAATEAENAPFLALSDVKTSLLNLDHEVTIMTVNLEKSVLALAPVSAEVHRLAQELHSLIYAERQYLRRESSKKLRFKRCCKTRNSRWRRVRLCLIVYMKPQKGKKQQQEEMSDLLPKI